MNYDFKSLMLQLRSLESIELMWIRSMGDILVVLRGRKEFSTESSQEIWLGNYQPT